jgi:hypothetical protein
MDPNHIELTVLGKDEGDPEETITDIYQLSLLPGGTPLLQRILTYLLAHPNLIETLIKAILKRILPPDPPTPTTTA